MRWAGKSSRQENRYGSSQTRGKKEDQKKRAAGHRPHFQHVQQHDRDDH
jgi:hypothetical protein